MKRYYLETEVGGMALHDTKGHGESVDEITANSYYDAIQLVLQKYPNFIQVGYTGWFVLN
ncbi:MAG: hypothetical protein J6Q48_07395 [Bacteroidaceae bacterium]|nr:hypothetical protein [Bacteroidaceae bacterium]